MSGFSWTSDHVGRLHERRSKRIDVGRFLLRLHPRPPDAHLILASQRELDLSAFIAAGAEKLTRSP